jgi:hypothetical protein
VVFGLAGPIVGSWLLVAAALVLAPAETEMNMVSALILALHPFAIFFAFMFGGIPAVAAGLCVLAADRAGASIPMRLVCAAAAGTAATTLYLVLMFSDRGHRQWASIWQLAAVGALAAVVCAWLTRRWR